ncbi:MAG: trypsin-like peptidase domain-containing protein [Gammaproteobacteria bacterium]|nr:trypsin-like peptidase domain-containing protein [Gammaproteobacteria bacterium]MCY3689304.1 trypsin-like peptidase domain-containing protein [Gammaproteobacteria bacterium]MDE0478746.1 trypsin-like peptidase domain-containing protein [Gammaproteobacteria bacterium]MDE0508413.1 trypsin-like peptidase domain-containing protein [Gammaproteobacteria bacterium]MXY90993.1 FHA domain-containing protein [Gammaproteobacteria bacterium]
MAGAPASSGSRFRRWAALPLFLLCLADARGAIPLPDHALREQAGAAVVNVLTDSGSGSGFLINGNGDVATNFHVVEGSRRISVKQGLRSVPASLVWGSPELDLAVIRMNGGQLADARPLALALVEPGPLQDVVAVGFPGAADVILSSNEATPSFTAGNVGRVVAGSWGDRELRIVQHNADISAGNSGGPLLDRCGRTVGINTGGPASRITLSSLFEGRTETASGVFFASFIGELADELRRQSIPFAQVADTCGAEIPASATAASSMPALAGNELAQSRNLLLILTLVAGLIAVLLIVALVSFGSFRQSLMQLGSGALRRTGQSFGLGRRENPAESLAGGPVTIRIGRGRGTDLRLNSPELSRLHAELTVSRNAHDGRLDYRLRDCGSSNGSHVFRDGSWQPVREQVVLASEPLKLGGLTTTAAELYANWRRENTGGAGASGAGPATGAAPGAGGGGNATNSPKDALPSGRVRRDERTGDVIPD